MNRALLIAGAIVLLGGVYVLFSLLLRSPSVPTGVPETGEVRVSTETIQEKTDRYVIDVEYPQFGIATVDAQIRKDVEGAVNEFKGYPENPKDMAFPQNELTIRYESVYMGPDILSAKLIISEYTGGAHPNTLISGLNFDRSGRRLLQSDAFALIGMTLQQVSEAATAQLKTKLGDTMFEEGANTNPENFSSFIIDKDNVTFIFQPYQTAAYAAGPQEVSFPRGQ